jgi:pimeloyl-ACP methyl ester carboxylesterase
MTVVFVHGWGATKELWWNSVSRLPEGVRGIAIDIRREPDAQSMGDLARWLSEWLIDLRTGAPPGHLYLAGHSMGGNLCAETALSYPDIVDGLILVDAALLVDGLPARARWSVSPTYGLAALRAARMAAWPFGLLGSRVRHDHDGGHWGPYARRAWLYLQGGDDYALQKHMQILLGNRITPERLKALTVPLLIIHGERDGVVPVEHARRFAAAIPDAMLRIMPRSMHCPMDWDPVAFAGYLSEFLNGSNAGAPDSE